MKYEIKKETITKNPEQTRVLGKILAKEILKEKNRKTAIVLGLKGDLGSGKTTFLQGFSKGLKNKEKILSPTFIIYRKFSILNFQNFYHFDCYRIKNSKEILDLKFKEIILNPKNIVAIEWPEKIKKMIPRSATIIKFKFVDSKTRKILIKENN